MTQVNPYRTGILTAIAAVSFFFADRTLASLERHETQVEAERSYDEGLRRLAKKDFTSALQLLERAHSLMRTRTQFTLGWTEALIAAGRRPQAARNLEEVLQQDSNDGKANLLFARLLAQESKADEAIAYYHRAIYGRWRPESEPERMSVRMELAEYLGEQKRTQELLSELLLLQQNTDQPQEIARLFLVAGSVSRAREMYRDILKRDPNDVDAYEGLAETNIRAGDFRSAEVMLLSALKHRPADEKIVKRLHFAHLLATSDPTPRRLSSAEKYARASRLLDSVQSRCGIPVSSEAKVERPTNEAAEEKLASAERLWNPGCSADEATSLLMNKLQMTQ